MKTLKFIIVLGLFYMAGSVVLGQSARVQRPKIVIGVVIDQMRWDYLYRYFDRYSSKGFRRLLAEGYSCENAFIPYLPTVTGVGHTSIFTGSVPALNGIIGNNWYERSTGKDMYCVADSSVKTIGSNTSAGKMSPKNIWGTTIGDELRFSSNYKSKVISVSMKDRGSIPSGGHTANGTYWYDATTGKWITSSYYMSELPEWVNRQNNNGYIDEIMKHDWQTLFPIESYNNSSADNKNYEEAIKGETTVTFPHKLSLITDKKYESFRYTPFAITYTFEMAKAAIKNENLGKNNVTDMLSISISPTDWIGHSFGPNSVEIEDTYLRLDKDIAAFLFYLDSAFGKQYVFFLTADHGVSPSPKFMWENKSPASTWEDKNLTKEVNQLVSEKFDISSVVLSIKNEQLYLHREAIRQSGKNYSEVISAIIEFVKKRSYVLTAFELEKISQAVLPERLKMMYVNAYNPLRSGDIQLVARTGFFSGNLTGSSHGGWSPYDAHVPLLWFGWHVTKGSTRRETYITDIAPTLAALLHIQAPNACVGKVITEVIN